MERPAHPLQRVHLPRAPPRAARARRLCSARRRAPRRDARRTGLRRDALHCHPAARRADERCGRGGRRCEPRREAHRDRSRGRAPAVQVARLLCSQHRLQPRAALRTDRVGTLLPQRGPPHRGETDAHARTHTRTHIHTHARTHARAHTRTRTHRHTHTRRHARTHARTRAHARPPGQRPQGWNGPNPTHPAGCSPLHPSLPSSAGSRWPT